MAYILPDDPSTKITISQPQSGRLLYKIVGGGSVVAASAGNWELAQIDMTRKSRLGRRYDFRKIFNMRVDELGGDAFSDGFSNGFE